jgi:hypothetical protein
MQMKADGGECSRVHGGERRMWCIPLRGCTAAAWPRSTHAATPVWRMTIHENRLQRWCCSGREPVHPLELSVCARRQQCWLTSGDLHT